jgi:TolA-binding protein
MLEKLLQTVTLFAVCAFATVGLSEESSDYEANKLLELANGLYVRGSAFYGQAIVQYREFLKRYPSDPRCDEATLFLGNCLREQEKYQEALLVYLDHQKYKHSPNRDKVDFRTGQVLFSQGRYPEAITYLLKVYNKNVEQSVADSAAFWLGWAYLKNNQAGEAVPVLAKLADGENNALVPWANFHLGYAYLATEAFDKAIERFQKASGSLPQRQAEALFRVAEAYAKLENYMSAYGAYKELVENHNQSPFVGRAAFGAVWSLYSAKAYDNAIQAYKACARFIPKESLAEAAYILGNSYYETNALSSALQSYEEIAKSFPTSPFAVKAEYKACWCLFLQDKFDGLILAGKAFTKKYPNYADISNIHFLVGESLYQRDRIQEALPSYQTVVAQYPGSSFREKAMFKLGLCFFKTKQLEKARQTFRDFVSNYAESPLATEAFARSAECGVALAGTKGAKPEFQRAQYEEVAKDYKALVEKHPKHEMAGEALYQLGITYAKLDKQNEMLDTFSKLVKSYPKNENCAEAFYWLGSESEKGEKYDEATQYFERSLTLKPAGPYAEQAQYRLAGIYSKKGEDEKAANLIVQMLRANLQANVPANTHLWAADFLLEKGNYAEAAAVYTLFVKKFKPGSTPLLEGAYYGLGECYFNQEKWQPAIDNFALAIDFEGKLTMLSKLNSGISHFKLGRTKQAESLLEEVSKSRISELELKAIYWLGNIYLGVAEKMKPGEERGKQYNLARAQYVQVVIYDRDNLFGLRPECVYRVAECLEQEGLSKEANDELRKLVEEYPNSEFAKRAREKLKTEPEGTTGQGS